MQPAVDEPWRLRPVVRDVRSRCEDKPFSFTEKAPAAVSPRCETGAPQRIKVKCTASEEGGEVGPSPGHGEGNRARRKVMAPTTRTQLPLTASRSSIFVGSLQGGVRLVSCACPLRALMATRAFKSACDPVARAVPKATAR